MVSACTEIKELNGSLALSLSLVIKLCVSNYNPTRLHNGDEKPRTTTKNMEPNVVLCKHIAAGFVFSAV